MLRSCLAWVQRPLGFLVAPCSGGCWRAPLGCPALSVPVVVLSYGILPFASAVFPGPAYQFVGVYLSNQYPCISPRYSTAGQSTEGRKRTPILRGPHSSPPKYSSNLNLLVVACRQLGTVPGMVAASCLPPHFPLEAKSARAAPMLASLALVALALAAVTAQPPCDDGWTYFPDVDNIGECGSRVWGWGVGGRGGGGGGHLRWPGP